MTTKVSVLICTRDRPDMVGAAIESVARCDYPCFDLHVMDQSTNDETRRIVGSIAARSADREIVYHHLDQAGLSRAYNAGVAVSDGTIVACTDDDVIVPSDWITRIVRAFEGDPQSALLFGQVLLPASLEDEAARGMIIPTLVWNDRRRLSRDQRNYQVWGMGANMAVRRAAFERIGGFDEAMGGGGPLRSSQDFDLSLRMYRAGYAVLLEPDVVVDHYGSRSPEQWPVTIRNYGIGDGAFYSKHIRCGDLLALRLLGARVARVVGGSVVRSARERRWPHLDEYPRGLAVGVRDASRFGIDRQHRLFRPTDRARFDATAANTITPTGGRAEDGHAGVTT